MDSLFWRVLGYLPDIGDRSWFGGLLLESPLWFCLVCIGYTNDVPASATLGLPMGYLF